MLTMDVDALAKAIKATILAETEELTDWIWTQVESEAPAEVDRAMMGREVLFIGNQIVGQVWAGGMQALITEWGSGSKADTSNPAWGDYIRSEYWNPLRDPGKHTIRGRAEGEYKDLDNQTRHSSGGMAGRNLEWKFPPMEPQHWMRQIMTLSLPTIIERYTQCIQQFPMHLYIYDGR